MAYSANEWAVIVEGTLAGSEVFANRWTILDAVGGSDLDDARDAFHDLYASWAGVCSAGQFAVNTITFRNLSTGAVVTPSWTQIIGQAADDPLPSQNALKVSLSAIPNRHGGPFMAGAGSTCLDGAGFIQTTDATGFRNALNALFSDLVAAGWNLRLDSPSDNVTRAIVSARLGRQFDTIRARRNQQPENFLTVTVAP